jgi:secondary thiamine-phosphate synthase enzyme
MSTPALHVFEVRTPAREAMVEITDDVARVAREQQATGIVFVFVPHTSAAVTINEIADPDVQRDMLLWLGRMVPASPDFRHGEGNSDAHIKASLLGATVGIPCVEGRLRLGTWQGIYLCEFDGPRRRRVEVMLG